MFNLSISSNLKEFERSLDDFASKQLPFATSLALTAIAKKVQQVETAELSNVFDNPTPFTRKAVGIMPARKNNLQAIIFIKDAQAKYLEPYELGGKHALNSRALLNPKDIRLNSYGNLPRGTLAKLKARRDVFIGPVKFSNGGVVSGVWQRLKHHKLKLLIRFGDPLEVKGRLDFVKKGSDCVQVTCQAEFTAAIKRALASAR